jgi:hypothetical protein
LANEIERVKLVEVCAIIANDLHRHIGCDCIAKRADGAAITTVSHDAPCEV